jgi:plastocyanin
MTQRRSSWPVTALLMLVLPVAILQAQSSGNSRMSVTVTFGAGLNTAQPGNAANHHVLPNTIEIKAGGAVNFAVAGFHQIVVYRPGVKVEDIVLPPFPPNLFVNYNLGTAYYVGINPNEANPATPTPSPAPNRFNGENRLESVSFSEPGVYLVICNVTPHLRDGMYAYIKVSN